MAVMVAETVSSRPIRLRFPGQFIRYLAAGVCGLAADGGVLLLLVGVFGWSGVAARLTSFAGAVLLTWTINRFWTFRTSGSGAPRAAISQFVDYAAIQAAGGAFNLAIYAIMLPVTHSHSLGLLLALGCGSAAGLLVNYVGARAFVFADRVPGPMRRIAPRVTLALGALALAAAPFVIRAGGAG